VGKVFFLPTITIIRYFWWAKKHLPTLQKTILNQMLKYLCLTMSANAWEPEKPEKRRRMGTRKINLI